MEISTDEAARFLGVGSDEVRRLLRTQALVGRRVGRMWLVDVSDVHRRRHLDPTRGRVWSAPVAFGAVLLLAGRSDLGLSDSEVSRLRRSLRGSDATSVVQRSRQLVITERWRVPATGIEWLLGQVGVFRTGEGAVSTISGDLLTAADRLGRQAVAIAVAEAEMERVRAGSRARIATDSANATVSVIRAARAECLVDERVQAVITALVLGTHADARVRRAAGDYIDERIAGLRLRGQN
jgi:excisionase family DNA binding protein